MYEYKIDIPSSINITTPVVITIHGMGSNYDDLNTLVPAIIGNAVSIHLQGDLSFGAGYAFFIPDFTKHSEESIIRPVIDKIYATITKIIADNNLQQQPIYLIGFSQGAIIGTGLINLYADFLTKVWLFSGRMPTFIAESGQKLTTKTKTDVFVSQGLIDPLFEPKVGQAIAKNLGSHVRTLQYKEYPSGHTIHVNTIVDAQSLIHIK
ncbi:alpha/beta hydrolase [Periweissella beninensis]|uniref:alpha/beta hydrolase n=1 Tax=Periweissella beninensis TaxID=504936 RepID=UPI0021A2A194|nr:phospholipase [Periweissella beninensis]MCT4395416.1 phospholipase [Periweissella beninensis]